MLNLVLFGAPGAGKGTQAERLTKRYNLIHLSTGDILRGELKAETQLGKKARKYMDKGILVPDEVVIGMIANKIEENKNKSGFIFDGFPRTEAQGIALDKLLKDKKTSITAMLVLEVNQDELVRRLLSRGRELGRTDDQDYGIIQNRIEVYTKETLPLIDFYKSQNKYQGIKGMGSINEISERLYKIIDTL